MSLTKPNFFIVGAPRCATTAMFDYLKVHPDIAMSSYKEPHYFGSDLRGLQFEIFRGAKQKYLRLFGGNTGTKWVGEASVYYLYSKNSASEIYEFNPSAHILIMLRSPIEVLHSLFYQIKLTGDNPYDTLEDLIADTNNIMQDVTINSRMQFLTGDGVRYYDQVRRYLNTFGKEQVQIILYEDFRDNTAEIYKDVLKFLDVDSDFQPISFKVVNPATKVRNPLIHRITSNKALIRLGMRFPIISIPIYRAIKVLNANKLERPSLSTTVTRQLNERVHDDILQLGQLINRDLTHWVNND